MKLETATPTVGFHRLKPSDSLIKVTPPISPSPEISSQIHAISACPSFVRLLLVLRFFRADDLQADDTADEQRQEEEPHRVGRLAQEHHADDGRPGRPDAGIDGVRHAGLQHRHRFREEIEADDEQDDGHRAWQRPREAFRLFHAVCPADLQQPADEYIKPCHDASDLSVIRWRAFVNQYRRVQSRLQAGKDTAGSRKGFNPRYSPSRFSASISAISLSACNSSSVNRLMASS